MNLVRNWKLLLLLTIAVVPFAVPAAKAHGVHITCSFDIAENDGHTKQNETKVLNFYLDDTSETLVAEAGEIAVKTTMYSDTQVDASIHDQLNNLMLFGLVIAPPAQLSILRTTGRAAVAADVLPKGAIVGAGDCKTVRSPPTKF